MTPAAARLLKAIEEWPSGSYTRLPGGARPSVKSFAQLAARSAKGAGASRGMLARYFSNDDITPEVPDRLLRVAAPLLGVRLEWLRRGDGAMTAAQETLDQQLETIGAKLDASLRRSLAPAGRLKLGPIGRGLLIETIAAYAPDADDTGGRAMCAQLVRLLERPLAWLGERSPEPGERRHELYVRAMFSALLLAAPDRRAAPPTQEGD